MNVPGEKNCPKIIRDKIVKIVLENNEHAMCKIILFMSAYDFMDSMCC